MANRPVERKVYAGSLGALTGSIVSDAALWGVDQLWWPASEVDIPAPVASFVSALVITAFTFIAGYVAKHDPGYTEIDEPPLPDV